MFNAIPTRERFASASFNTLPDFVPRYTEYHPGFVTGGDAREYNRVHPALPSIGRWHGWELLVRGMVSHDDYPRTTNQTAALVGGNGPKNLCYCYRQILGGAERFWPSVMNKTALRLARPRVRDFRLAWLKNLGTAGPGVDVHHRIIFILRHHGPRQIINEHELREHVAKASDLDVRFVVFDGMPLLQQHALVATSTGLAGVHGAGLTWTAFLPSDKGRRCGLLELMSPQIPRTHSFIDYVRWATMSNVKYYHLVQPDAPECAGKYFRVCGNIRVNAAQVASKMQEMMMMMRGNT
jgi:hypothetical protein